jgi:alpha-tubulin suppressor-like RCC1 family protein
MARLADGTLRCWGNNTDGQCTVPLSLGAVLGFDGGVYHSVAVDASGGVRCWGLNDFGQSIPPVKLASVASVSAGDRHTVALLSDGTVRCWGQDTYGQCSPPSSLPALQEISASDRYSLGLTTNGRVVRWGQEHGTLPGPETECTMIAAGAYHGVAALVQRDCETPCPADITGNGAVDGVDLAAVLGAWGGVGGGKSGADVNRDGSVDAADLAAVLGAWGPCP